MPDKQDNLKHELLMVLQRMELENENEGRLFYICTKTWEVANINSSLRYNVFKTMMEISKKHPDRLAEIKTFTDAN